MRFTLQCEEQCFSFSFVFCFKLFWKGFSVYFLFSLVIKWLLFCRCLLEQCCTRSKLCQLSQWLGFSIVTLWMFAVSLVSKGITTKFLLSFMLRYILAISEIILGYHVCCIVSGQNWLRENVDFGRKSGQQSVDNLTNESRYVTKCLALADTSSFLLRTFKKTLQFNFPSIFIQKKTDSYSVVMNGKTFLFVYWLREKSFVFKTSTTVTTFNSSMH